MRKFRHPDRKGRENSGKKRREGRREGGKN